MDTLPPPTLLFGVQLLIVSAVNVTAALWYALPWLRRQDRSTALRPLLLVQALRIIGVTFIVPGVADPHLPVDLAVVAAAGAPP